MLQDIYHTALQTGLHPLEARIAAIVADVEGPQRGYSFINSVREEHARDGGASSVVEVITPIRESAAFAAEPALPPDAALPVR